MNTIKMYLLSFSLAIISFSSFSQFIGEIVITGTVTEASDACPIDLDRDGDLDVISASIVDGQIAW
jgi:hypothetical protein